MKPELKAFWQAILDTPTGDPNGIHWRVDELWCGRFCIASVWTADADGTTLYMGGFGGVNGKCGDWKSEKDAKTAIETAAREQIKTVFKE